MRIVSSLSALLFILASITACKWVPDEAPTPVSYKINAVEWYLADTAGTVLDTFTFSFRLQGLGGDTVLSTPVETRAKTALPYTQTNVWGSRPAHTDLTAAYFLTFAVKDSLFDATDQVTFSGAAFAPGEGETETTIETEAGSLHAKVHIEWAY